MAIAKLYALMPVNALGSNSAGGSPMDILSDTIKALLTTSSNTISQTADTVKADLTNELAATGGYTTGGEPLASKTWDAASLVSTFDAADVTWGTATFTAHQLHLYDDTPTTPADPLISYVDFEGAQTVTAADFTIQWNASGIFAVTVA